ncbi:MAG TPA: hypothetical protein VIF60_05440 [Burkholderiaceae bacterium]|jgi:hypothetical protein
MEHFSFFLHFYGLRSGDWRLLVGGRQWILPTASLANAGISCWKQKTPGSCLSGNVET